MSNLSNIHYSDSISTFLYFFFKKDKKKELAQETDDLK